MSDCNSKGIVNAPAEGLNGLIDAIVVEGGKSKLAISASGIETLLCEVIKQQKITNLHLAILSDNYIDDKDIKDD